MDLKACFLDCLLGVRLSCCVVLTTDLLCCHQMYWRWIENKQQSPITVTTNVTHYNSADFYLIDWDDNRPFLTADARTGPSKAGKAQVFLITLSGSFLLFKCPSRPHVTVSQRDQYQNPETEDAKIESGHRYYIIYNCTLPMWHAKVASVRRTDGKPRQWGNIQHKRWPLVCAFSFRINWKYEDSWITDWSYLSQPS